MLIKMFLIKGYEGALIKKIYMTMYTNKSLDPFILKISYTSE